MHEPTQSLKRRALTPYDVPVPLDRLGGLKAVAEWLDRVPRMSAIVGSLLTMRSQSVYAENRFLNVSSAAEGLHRALFGKGAYMPRPEFDALRRSIRAEKVPPDHHRWFNNIMAHANDFDLDRRLHDLVADLGEPAKSLIGSDVASWVKAIKKARNHLTHLDEGQEHFDGADLHWLGESLFQVARLCLLKGTVLQAEQVPEVVRHVHGWGNVDRLEGVVRRIAGLPAPD